MYKHWTLINTMWYTMKAGYGIMVFAALLTFGHAKFDSTDDNDQEGSYIYLIICFLLKDINHLSVYKD